MSKRAKQAKPSPAVPARSETSIIRVAAYALALLAVFLAPLIAGRLDSVPNLAVQGIVLAAALLWVLAPGKDGVRLPARLSLLSVILFTFMLVSTAGTVSRNASLAALLNFGSYLCIFLMASSLKDRRDAAYGLIAVLLLSAIIVGAIGLREYIPNLREGAVTWRTFSTFFNPDYLAGFMVMLLPVALAWYLSKTSPGVTAISVIGVVFCGVALAITGSRFGALAGAGGIFIFLLLAVRSRSMGRFQWMRMVPVLIALVLALAVVGKPILNRITNVKTEAHSGSFRVYTWMGTARMSAAHPFFGTGIGTFETAYPRHALVGYTALAHNSYLQLAAEAGIPAALILILLAAGAWVPACASAAKGLNHSDENRSPSEFAWLPDANLMLCGIVAGTAASLMRNAVDSDWYITGVGLSFWALLGAGVALARNEKHASLTMGREARMAAVAVAGIMLLASLLLLGSASKLASGEGALADSDAYTAVEDIKRSATLNPFDPEPHRMLGKIYAVTDAASPAQGSESRAVAEMKKAVQLEPSNAKSYYQLAKIYEGEARPRDAVRAYEMGLRFEPHSPQVLLALALAYESAGMNPEALGIWRRLAAQEETPYEEVKAIPEIVAPEYIFAQAGLAREAERLRDRESARLHYRKALSRIERYEASMHGMGKVWGERSASANDIYALVESLKQEISGPLPFTGSSGK